jgi:hypothetical protein
VMFALLVAFVYAVGRGRLLGGRRS